MFPGLTELLLIGCLMESIWTPKSKSNTLTPKTQLADILTKGNFTRDEWNHLLCLFNISHFSSTVCSDTMPKRSQHNSGEERVTAKSRPRMNLIARTPSFVSSSTSVSPGKIYYGNQDPWKSVVGEDRLGQPGKETVLLESFSSTDYSKLEHDRVWSSQEWKADIETYERSGRPDETSWRMTREVRPGFSHEETLYDGTAQSVMNEETVRDRSGQPDIDSREEAWPQQFVIGNDEAELELSVESRSFVNRVNDQVRKRQKIISNFTENGEKHSMIWWMFMAVAMESAVFIGKNYLNNCQFIVITADLTLEQTFDISTKLVSEQDEISGLETIGWENHLWKYLSLIGDDRIINLQRTKVYIFSDSVLCLGKIFEKNPESNEAWEQRLGWIKSSQNYRNFDRIDGEPMEVEWNIFPGFNTLQLSEEVKSFCTDWEKHQKITQ